MVELSLTALRLRLVLKWRTAGVELSEGSIDGRLEAASMAAVRSFVLAEGRPATSAGEGNSAGPVMWRWRRGTCLLLAARVRRARREEALEADIVRLGGRRRELAEWGV